MSFVWNNGAPGPQIRLRNSKAAKMAERHVTLYSKKGFLGNNANAFLDLTDLMLLEFLESCYRWHLFVLWLGD